MKIPGIAFVVTLCVQVPLWLHNNRKETLSLKEDFENDRIDKDYYRSRVGERFYKKHHNE